ncbi:MAG: putative ABC exporter domain-containing protein [Gemmatimonadaceae bacterium]
MSGPASAIRYLWVRGTINRLRTQAKRVRNPRYAIAMLVGLAYFYWILIQNPRASSQAGVNPFVDLMQMAVLLPIASAFLLFLASRWWLFKGDRASLAFTPAEVQFLFPAPISRRGLVHAKLLRGQVAILINITIWTVLLRGNAASAAGWQRGLALWLLFSTISLHRLGAALVRTNALDHERAGQRRSIIPASIFMIVLGCVAWGIVGQWSVIQLAAAQSVKAATDAIAAALAQPVPALALWPVRALLKPVLAQNGAQWLSLVPFSALVFGLHYLWVLRLDASFEEAAIEATQVRAEAVRNVRSAGGVRKRNTSGKIARVPALSLTGRPEIAIAWKNVTAAIRGTAWRAQTIMFLIILTAVAAVVSTQSEKAADVFLIMCAAWGAMLLLIGPLSMRYDFRHDLPRLAILRTYPLTGGKIVAAEIAAVTLLHSISIWTLMIVPVTLFALSPSRFTNAADVPVILLSIALAIPAFNALTFTVHNGAALLFPSWVRLGTEPRGFETMGQNLLTMVATTLVAAVAMVFPVGLAFLIIWLATASLGVWAILVATLAASVLLCLELWPVIFWLGSVFDRIDVAEVAPVQ